MFCNFCDEWSLCHLSHEHFFTTLLPQFIRAELGVLLVGEEMEALCSYLGGVLSGRRGQRSAAAGAAAAGDDVIASAPGDVDQVRGAQKRGRDMDTAAGRGAGTAACRMRVCG